MPALLFEAGVIVNRDEELKLRDENVQKQIAAGVAAGASACLNGKDEGGRMNDEGKINSKKNGNLHAD
jgi:N-acetylmuramoyl-L-alanine amidase